MFFPTTIELPAAPEDIQKGVFASNANISLRNANLANIRPPSSPSTEPGTMSLCARDFQLL
jgi:hypothetical protein